jgi:hypothetical protein
VFYCTTKYQLSREGCSSLITQKSRTVGRSFRINEEWLNTANEEAERTGISPNSLINKILQDYSKYQRHFKRVSGIALTQKSFSRIVEACSKEAITDIAKKAGSKTALDIFRTMGFQYDNKDATFFVTTILAEYANWFKCEHYIANHKEYFHLRHDLGENWSIYVAEVVSTLLESCCNKKIKKEFLDGAITLEIQLSSSDLRSQKGT